MKKMLSIILALILVFSLPACSSSAPSTPTETAATPETEALTTEPEPEIDTTPEETAPSDSEKFNQFSQKIAEISARSSTIDYVTAQQEDYLVVNLTIDGIDEGVAEIRADYASGAANWDTVLGAVFSETAYNNIISAAEDSGYTDPQIAVNLISAIDPSVIYATSINGELVFDCFALQAAETTSNYSPDDLVAMLKHMLKDDDNTTVHSIELSDDSIIVTWTMKNADTVAASVRSGLTENTDVWDAAVSAMCGDTPAAFIRSFIKIYGYENVGIVLNFVGESDPGTIYATSVNGILTYNLAE